MFHHFRPVALLAVALLVTPALTAGHASGGPLDPPPGPVASTQRTLIFSLPHTISAPGVYVLAANLASPLPGDIITVTSNSYVTLDLAGHSISGASGTNLAPAILVTGSGSVTIRNGSIDRWGGGAIQAATSPRCLIENICFTTSPETFSGISVGRDSIVRGCRMSLGSIIVGNYSLVENCALGGSGTKLVTGPFSVVRGCTADDVQGCSSLSVGSNSMVSECSFGPNCVLGDGTVFSRCAVRGGVSLCGSFPGISAGAGCLIEGCSISDGNTIVLSSGSTVRGCTIRGVFGSRSGVQITGSGNRVEDNNISIASSATTFGIATGPGVTGNFVARNTVSGASSLANAFSNPTGNTFGPIFDARALGQLNGTTANQAHPWANFWY